MTTKGQLSHTAIHAMMLVLGSGLPCFAQDGKLAIQATPKQAYVFVDDHAVGEASHHRSLKLSAGDHKVALVNYGYTPVTRTVTITGGQTTDLEIALSAMIALICSAVVQAATFRSNSASNCSPKLDLLMSDMLVLLAGLTGNPISLLLRTFMLRL